MFMDTSGHYLECNDGQFQLIKQETGTALPVFISHTLDDKVIKPNEVTDRIGITWQDRFRNFLWMFKLNCNDDIKQRNFGSFKLKANIDSKRSTLVRVFVENKKDGLYFREV